MAGAEVFLERGRCIGLSVRTVKMPLSVRSRFYDWRRPFDDCKVLVPPRPMPLFRLPRALSIGFVLALLPFFSAPADLVIVQKTEGLGQSGTVTVKLRGGKM